MNRKKLIVWLICSIPLWIIVGKGYFLPPTDPKFWSFSLTYSAYSAVVLLAICLVMKRFKKVIGLCAFYYALLHMSSYFIKKVIKTGAFPWEYLVHPMVIFGELAFIILLALAVTSTKWSKQKMGREKWKTLHRAVYFAEIFIFIHMVMQGETVLLWAMVIFIPLFTIQCLRKWSWKGSGSHAG